MKFTKDQINTLEMRLLDCIEMDTLKTKYEEYQSAKLSYIRFIWDWFWRSNTTIGDGIGLTTNCGLTIPDCHDNHIETALKHIAKKHGLLPY